MSSAFDPFLTNGFFYFLAFATRVLGNANVERADLEKRRTRFVGGIIGGSCGAKVLTRRLFATFNVVCLENIAFFSYLKNERIGLPLRGLGENFFNLSLTRRGTSP